MKYSEFELSSRLNRLRSMSQTDRETAIEHITRNLPKEYRPWPFGMPLSADPSIVIVGVSPGNSPTPNDTREKSNYGGPTFGKPHPGFFYPDTKSYWEKVRSLCSEALRLINQHITDDDALSLSGHLNLGTGQFGTATDAAVEDRIVPWVSNLLGSVLAANVVITFGLNGILTMPKYGLAWNQASGALQVNWKKPDIRYAFQKYSFRVWTVQRSNGRPVLVCMWPNHPSRHPFTGGADGEWWQQSLLEFRKILQDHLHHA